VRVDLKIDPLGILSISLQAFLEKGQKVWDMSENLSKLAHLFALVKELRLFPKRFERPHLDRWWAKERAQKVYNRKYSDKD